MISVLIPIYNYEISDLVNIIHKQLCICDVPYEIICFDDGSNETYLKSNSKINTLQNTSLIVSNKNVGRIKARQILTNHAKYDWLLFLDADVLPKKKSFIKTYIDTIESNSDVYFGGVCYEKKKPKKEYILRWKYGSLKEEMSAIKRQQKPYKLIASANMLIKKSVFHKINSTIDFSGYGMDNYFGAKLKENGSKVTHIDNYVYHLGIEKSTDYLKKKEQAADTLLHLLNKNAITDYDNKLLLLFVKLKQLGINYVFAFLFKIFRGLISKNSSSKNPSIKLLQFYRISYMCYRDLKPKEKK